MMTGHSSFKCLQREVSQPARQVEGQGWRGVVGTWLLEDVDRDGVCGVAEEYTQKLPGWGNVEIKVNKTRQNTPPHS